jgi:hypothetical protein
LYENQKVINLGFGVYAWRFQAVSYPTTNHHTRKRVPATTNHQPPTTNHQPPVTNPQSEIYNPQ